MTVVKEYETHGPYAARENRRKQRMLFVYAGISAALAAVSFLAPEGMPFYAAVWILITFSLWLYLFLTMLRLLCDLQSLQKMREELFELRYQEASERLMQFRKELRRMENRAGQSVRMQEEPQEGAAAPPEPVRERGTMQKEAREGRTAQPSEAVPGQETVQENRKAQQAMVHDQDRKNAAGVTPR